MPIYTYECPAGHESEDLKKVDDRHTNPCPECGATATLRMEPVHFDGRMGLDPGFPTAYDRWAKVQRAKNSGKQWDSANRSYGGEFEKQK
jgi:putative FmdB family regulatory protein